MLVDDQRALLQRLIDWAPPRQGICLLTASASRLPLADESVDTILASPPYLTRIDYAAAYARELAIMGFDIARDRTLRETLMGTTLIRSSDHNHNGSSYGPLALSLVRQVGEHESKASAGYYLKQVRQYLDDLAASLREISRVAKMGAMMTLVVQDSYYKDIHIPLAQICIEQAEKQGWNLNSLAPKEVSRILTHMNTAARKYPKGRVNESVVVLKKERERG
jgi:tRNA G10  N-methylase Trm11